MNEITRILDSTGRVEPEAAKRLLPIVYDELRRLAAKKLAREAAGQTLDATGLVHEAYLRLVGDQQFDHRGHFFAAAAEAMRRILIENARRKQSDKQGGDKVRHELDLLDPAAPAEPDDLIALDEALRKLAQVDPTAERLVKLRYFSGLTIPQVAEVLGVSPRTADRLWAYARAFLHAEIYSEN
jgi:RNA polymerase sigma factor (TIGR02999 family)